ncbi:MAG: hypothetical protein CV087_11430 [Candidatus Brocadia sp. WS118]|nr:MAG: hypothetical protein CV087_11430 [Candidatus Brocadia sp. WS118]
MKSKVNGMFLRRCFLVLMGTLLTGMGISFMRISQLGTDPYSAFTLSISLWQVCTYAIASICINAVLLIFQFFTSRKSIGIGSFVSMFCVGLSNDFFYNAYLSAFSLPSSVIVQWCMTAAAVASMAFGVACFLSGNLGVAPYDALAPVFSEWTQGRISFSKFRIITDAVSFVLALFVCFSAGISLHGVIGLNTIVVVIVLGPCIQFFRDKVTQPWIDTKQEEASEVFDQE